MNYCLNNQISVLIVCLRECVCVKVFSKLPNEYSPKSPLELESVKLGVPSVQVGVEPSPDAGGVQAKPPLEP